MKIHEKHKNYWRLLLEDGEQLETVVEAFARASFEMAKPVGISANTSFDPETKWETIRADALKGQRSGRRPILQQTLPRVTSASIGLATKLGKLDGDMLRIPMYITQEGLRIWLPRAVSESLRP